MFHYFRLSEFFEHFFESKNFSMAKMISFLQKMASSTVQNFIGHNLLIFIGLGYNKNSDKNILKTFISEFYLIRI